jgi:NMD protein affecting ribosome stability and mRNA decay
MSGAGEQLCLECGEVIEPAQPIFSELCFDCYTEHCALLEAIERQLAEREPMR